MRIGYDVTALRVPQTGVGTYTLNLLQALKDQPDCTLVPLAPPVAGTDRRRANRTWWMQLRLPLQASALGVDLCHFTNNVAPLYLPLPFVMTLHDMTLWLYPEYHTLRGLLVARPVIPQAVRRADAIITVSESARADIVRILRTPAEKVHVIPEAPAPQFRPIEPGPVLDRIRAAYSLPERFILHVGSIEPRKNLLRLLRAFAQLRGSGAIPHDLVMVGDAGWKNSQVYALVAELGLESIVHFPGHVPLDDLVGIYNLAELMAFPSLYEGFGLPVVEAMACGTPVLCSPRGSLREVAAEAVSYIDPLNVDSIAAGLQRTLCDAQYRAALRQKGLAQAARYSWQQAAAQTRQVYEGVLGARQRVPA